MSSDNKKFISSFCGVDNNSTDDRPWENISFGKFSPCLEDVVILGVTHICFLVFLLVRFLVLKQYIVLNRWAVSGLHAKCRIGDFYCLTTKSYRRVLISLVFACGVLMVVPLLQLQGRITSSEIGLFETSTKLSAYEPFTLSLSSLCFLLLIVMLLSYELRWTLVDGFWMYRFIILFEFAALSIKLIFVVKLAITENKVKLNYFFYLFIVQYSAILYASLIMLLFHPKMADYRLCRRSLTLGNTDLESPLLQVQEEAIDDDDQPVDTVEICPEYQSSLFSRLFFNWVTKLITKGHEKPLESHEVWKLEPESEASSQFNKFQLAWNTEKQKRNPSLLSALKSVYLKRYMVGGLWKVLNDASQFVGPLVLKLVIKFINDENASLAYGLMTVVLLFSGQIIGACGEGAYYQNVMRVGLAVRCSLSSAIFVKTTVVDFVSSSDVANKGKVINLMASDCEALQSFCQNGHVLWSSPFRIVVSLVLLYAELGVSSFIGLLILIVSLPLQRYIISVSQRLLKVSLSKTDERLKIETELVDSMLIAKMYNWEASFLQKVSEVRAEELRWLKKSAILRSINSFFISAVPVIVSVASFGAYVLLGNELTASIAFTSLSLFAVLRMPLILLPQVINQLVSANVSIVRLQEFLLQPDISEYSADVSSNERQVEADGTVIRLEGNYCYGKSVIDPVLKDIDMSIQRGECVAVVGSTGSGKSSILAALLNEMNCLNGTAFIKGSISYVPQEAWIFNATIRDNIIFGKPFDAALYARTIHASCLKNDLESMVAGDFTELGEGGVNLSGGQKQRISIARALYSEADVVLMDDPLSALDARVARKVFEEAICSMLVEKTIVFVTNRIEFLNTNRGVNRVAYIKDGRIEGIKPYDQLIRTCENFQHLIQEMGISESNDEQEDESPDAKQESTVAYHIMDKQDVKNIQSSKLVQKEHRAVGGLRLEVVSEYVGALGGTLVLLSILGFYCLSEVARNLSSMWISVWTGGSLHETTAFFIAVYSLISLANLVFELCNQLTFAYRGTVASKVLHHNMFVSLLKAPMSFFNATPTGRISNRLSKDIGDTDKYLIGMTSVFVRGLVQLLGSLIVIGLSTPYALITFVPILCLFYFVQRWFQITSRELKRLDALSRSPVISHFSSCYEGMTSIRAFRRVNEMADISFVKLNKSAKINLAMFSCNRWLSIRLEFLGGILIFSTGLLIVFGRKQLGASVAGLTLSYALSLTGLLNMIVRLSTLAENSFNSVERIQEYSKLDREVECNCRPEDRVNPPLNWPFNGSIEFNNVVATYRSDLPPVLKGLSFRIQPKEKVGIVGRTGAGKSSLFLTLFRIINVQEGNIKIDKIDIAGVSLDTLRSKLSIIPQDPVVYHGTRFNLDPFSKHTEDELWVALERSNLKETVMANPFKLDMVIAAGGSNFSVGMRQLLCLARALLRKSKIIVLDEATAAVDVESDNLIQNTIRTEFCDCTTLTIAHRLNTIIDCDKVIVMDQGRAIEVGKPSELLANANGAFSSLVDETGAESSKSLRAAARGDLSMMQMSDESKSKSLKAQKAGMMDYVRRMSLSHISEYSYGQSNRLEETRRAIVTIKNTIEEIQSDQLQAELKQEQLNTSDFLKILKSLLQKLFQVLDTKASEDSSAENIEFKSVHPDVHYFLEGE